jgi:hypothetical protein
LKGKAIGLPNHGILKIIGHYVQIEFPKVLEKPKPMFLYE